MRFFSENSEEIRSGIQPASTHGVICRIFRVCRRHVSSFSSISQRRSCRMPLARAIPMGSRSPLDARLDHHGLLDILQHHIAVNLIDRFAGNADSGSKRNRDERESARAGFS
jgi:hypothetical protein